MRQTRSARRKLIRGVVLSGSIMAFVPALLLVSAQAEVEDEGAETTVAQNAAPAPTATPSRSSGSSSVPPVVSTPAASQTSPQTAAPAPRTRARTRAS